VSEPELHVFMMGEFEAKFPADRWYATNHMWGLLVEPDRYRCGLTGYAVRLLQDVYFLDWSVEAPCFVRHRQGIGSIESKKAESELFAPVAGTIREFSSVALTDPAVINTSIYDEGWLFEMDAPGSKWMTIDEYLQHLEGAWVVAQRTIKGQVG
jgi:glycine cleavage system H protein